MATPTYKELADALNATSFLDRCTIAVVKYSQYIIGENPATALHSSRVAWAKNAIQNPASIIGGIKWAIIYDSAFTTQNPLDVLTTPDSVIQSSVEATINATYLTF